jgi:hypothetical protein
VLARDVQAADVVETAVVGFADQRVDRSHLLVARLSDRVAHDGVHRRADAQRVGQHDRRLDRTELVDLCRSRQLAERIADKHRPGDLVLKHVAAVRHDRGDARTHTVTLDDGRVPDAHALDVRDRIRRAGWIDARSDAHFTRPGPRLRRRDDDQGGNG